MEQWNYKIKNDNQLQNELLQLSTKYQSIKEQNYPKGKEMILLRLEKIKNIVMHNMAFDTKKSSFANLLPFLEFNGGKEFIESEEGKDIIEVFFYFAYKWNPAIENK